MAEVAGAATAAAVAVPMIQRNSPLRLYQRNNIMCIHKHIDLHVLRSELKQLPAGGGSSQLRLGVETTSGRWRKQSTATVG